MIVLGSFPSLTQSGYFFFKRKRYDSRPMHVFDEEGLMSDVIKCLKIGVGEHAK